MILKELFNHGWTRIIFGVRRRVGAFKAVTCHRTPKPFACHLPLLRLNQQISNQFGN